MNSVRRGIHRVTHTTATKTYGAQYGPLRGSNNRHRRSYSSFHIAGCMIGGFVAIAWSSDHRRQETTNNNLKHRPSTHRNTQHTTLTTTILYLTLLAVYLLYLTLV